MRISCTGVVPAVERRSSGRATFEIHSPFGLAAWEWHSSLCWASARYGGAHVTQKAPAERRMGPETGIDIQYLPACIRQIRQRSSRCSRCRITCSPSRVSVTDCRCSTSSGLRTRRRVGDPGSRVEFSAARGRRPLSANAGSVTYCGGPDQDGVVENLHMTRKRGKASVLFVCMGNICRSPTAEGVFRHVVEASGLGDVVHIDSAGTHDYHVGEPPDRRSQTAAERRGYSLSALRARLFEATDFARFDYVLPMDRENLSYLESLAGAEHRHRLKLFLNFCRGPRRRSAGSILWWRRRLRARARHGRRSVSRVARDAAQKPFALAGVRRFD